MTTPFTQAVAVPQSVTTGAAIRIKHYWDKWIQIDTTGSFVGTVRVEARDEGGDWYLVHEQVNSPAEVVRVEMPYPDDYEVRANTTAYTSGAMTLKVTGRR